MIANSKTKGRFDHNWVHYSLDHLVDMKRVREMSGFVIISIIQMRILL